jgi:peptide/nickel transport system substrate-binding protein
MALAFEAGGLDLAFGLPVESVAELTANPTLIVKSFPVGYQYMAILNTKRPALGDARVREAIDLGVDRGQLVAAIGGGVAATGPFASYFPFAEKSPRPTDIAAAKTLLDAAGWKPGADGLRAKDGQTLKLKVMAYPQRPDLVTMLPVVKSQLWTLGFDVDTGLTDDPSSAAASGDFDLFLWAQHTAPSGDPAYFFNAMLRSGASLNFSGYASAAFDGLIAQFAKESDPDKRSALARAADAQIFKDAPIAFLVSPVWYVGVSKRLANYQPWGSDYHVLRADIGEAR